jgi:hypothetical protein
VQSLLRSQFFVHIAQANDNTDTMFEKTIVAFQALQERVLRCIVSAVCTKFVEQCENYLMARYVVSAFTHTHTHSLSLALTLTLLHSLAPSCTFLLTVSLERSVPSDHISRSSPFIPLRVDVSGRRWQTRISLSLRTSARRSPHSDHCWPCWRLIYHSRSSLGCGDELPPVWTPSSCSR